MIATGSASSCARTSLLRTYDHRIRGALQLTHKTSTRILRCPPEIRDSLSVEIQLDADIFDELVKKTKFSPSLVKSLLVVDALADGADLKYKELGEELHKHYTDRVAMDAATSVLEDQEAFNWSVKGLNPDQKKLRRKSKQAMYAKVARAKNYINWAGTPAGGWREASAARGPCWRLGGGAPSPDAR